MLHNLLLLGVVSLAILLLTKQASLIVWSITFAMVALLFERYGSPAVITQILLATIFTVLILFTVKPLRRKLISQYLFQKVAKVMPSMSSTEREALGAGTVGWEGDLFSGNPDFKVLLSAPVVKLTAEEQVFLDGPVNELCRMIDDWEITHVLTDMPPEMWRFLKEKGFFGLIIPKEYGGHDFSATAQMTILARINGRSITVGSTVSVPNSLGPAELLLKYGTQEQKDFYLPRLADGREIPCFALTGPNAGSDAASIPDKGIVCYQELNGQKILGLRLTWDKRYITLCPVATVIGLAFRLFDPENILGKGKDVGISCALIPANTPGVIKGRRHFPLNTAFLNGPTQGKNVFVPIDSLIGGPAMAGLGWRMLMECLSAGRAISLPSSSAGGSQAAALACGAYAGVRKQFNLPIAQFEGIEEPLARVAANAYIIDAGLTMTVAAIDSGAKPSIAGAILKYHTTERGRQVVMDAMDIHGGKGICLGPNNYLGRGYQNTPIGITVEGANILTRNLIIFGQGAIRCHPYIFLEMESIKEKNLKAFDAAFWGHTSFVLANLTKSLIFAFTDGYFISVPKSTAKRYFQLVHRYSTNLAFLADFSMMVIGGGLKRKEMISARLGDVLSNLYLISAVLKRFHDEGEPPADLALVEWSCQEMFHECELAIRGVISNFPHRWARLILKFCLQPFGSQRLKPSDLLSQKLAHILTEPNETRTRLTRFVFKEPVVNCPLGRLEDTFIKLCAAEDLEKRVNRAVKEGALHSLTLLEQIDEAEEAAILTAKEAEQLKEAELGRQKVIAVDDFADEDLRRQSIDYFFNQVKTRSKDEDDVMRETV
ncbi:MAG: acyl-CoA dehydrogenase [Tatlockia sp.]|nr:acyl-CoA dehydrogenase [Tatlockia sp.]